MISAADTTGTIVILIDDTSCSDMSSLLIQQQLVRAAQEASRLCEAMEFITRPEPLMYKGWMTPEQYNKYLYLQLFKSNVKSIKAKGHNYIGDLKTFRRYQRR